MFGHQAAYEGDVQYPVWSSPEAMPSSVCFACWVTRGVLNKVSPIEPASVKQHEHASLMSQPFSFG